MNYVVSIETSGNPERALVGLRTYIAGDGPRNIIGYEGRRTVQEHLQGLDATRPNRLGGRRTHYYGSARRATEYFVEGEDVIINIAQVGMSLHYYGGTVEAGKNTSYITGQPTKYLTIPACAAAHGHSVSDFPDLVLVWGRNRKPVGLAIGEEPTGSLYRAITRRGPILTKSLQRQLVPGKMMFWLKAKVTLQPDPSVLPTPDTMSRNITDVLGRAIQRKFRGQTIGIEGEGI